MSVDKAKKYEKEGGENARGKDEQAAIKELQIIKKKCREENQYHVVSI